MTAQVNESFSAFYDTWFWQLEQLQHQLMKLQMTSHENEEEELQALVSRVTNLHKEYYTAKWAAASQDVLAFFCPIWSTPLENSLLWITGWKPSMLLKLLLRVQHVSDQQWTKIEELRVRIKCEEEKVEREMERHQVAMVERKMVELARLSTRNNDGVAVDALVDVAMKMEVAMKVVKIGLKRVMKEADCVRLKALKGVLDLLSPLQCVVFLGAFGMVQIRLRQCGRRTKNILLIDLNSLM